MSNVSIYEKKWLDLVFEHKNKMYGAYQLRRNSNRTTLKAFFFGILFIGTFAGLTMVLSSFGAKPIATDVIIDVVIRPVDLTYKPFVPKLPKANPAKKEAVASVIRKKELNNPTVVANTQNPENVATNAELNQNQNPDPGNSTGTGMPSTATTPFVGTSEIPVAVPSNVPVIAAVLDKLPEFPGGLDKFYKYVGNNFEKPEIDAQKTIKILVAFVIEKDGSMTDIKVLRNPGYGLDKEAIRVLKALKIKWSPGIMNGKPVRTAYNLPISVQMQ